MDEMDASDELIPDPSAEVKMLLQSAFQANWYLLFDTLIDKLILHPLAGDLITKAYQIACADLNVHSYERLQATLEFGRLLRFRGNWDEALRIFSRGEFDASGTYPEIHDMFLLELGSLQFEQGSAGGFEIVEAVFEKIRKKGITVLLVKAFRQLGNMYREHSDWEKAEKYLTSALTIAEILKDIEDSTPEKSLPNSLYLLWIDCIRERASLLAQQGKSDEAIQQLNVALQATQLESIMNAGEYLRGVILYQLGKINLQHIRDERTAMTYLEQSLEILHKYDNPIRLAFVFDALGGVLSRTHTLGGSKEKAERYFEKAKRIRELSKHEYFVAYSIFRQAESSQLHGDLQKAIVQFQQARTTFNKLGKTYDLGLAWLQLGKCYYQTGDRGNASKTINSALEEFKKLSLDSKIREAEFLRMRLLLNDPLKYDPGRDLRELLRQQTENYKFHLNEIGEYTFHEWIKEMSKGKIPNVTLLKAPYKIREHTEEPDDNRLRKLVSVGIGDDAAVLAIPGSEIYEVVLTTDAAPGSLSRSVDVNKGKYAAKFSVVHSVSDILAMGATPVAILLNFYMNREATLEYAMAVLETVADIAADYGVALIGGDLKERKEQSIGCMALGVVEKGKSISRSTARGGQVVAITLAGMPDGSGVRKIGCRWAQEVIEYMGLSEREPYKSFVKTDWKRDMLFLCHKEMIAGARTGLIRSAIDTSDGVMACLELIGRNSGVSFELDEALIEQIIDDRVKEISKALEFRPSQFLFNAGHDWEIVLTVEENDFGELQKAFRQAGGDLARLGIVRPYDPSLKGGISMISSRNQKKIWIPFFTDEKFVLRAYEERELDWEDLSFYINGARELN
jgi:thiamin-phosphate kinase